jgi:hypothetical protein
MRNTIFTYILLSLFFISPSNAIQINKKFGSKIFIKCDSDKDGTLNKKEYFNMSDKRFKRMDTNKNKKVSLKELKETQLAKIMPILAFDWFNRHDLDKNGIVLYSEMKNVSDTKFASMDKDNSKKLSSYEWQNFNPSFNKR